MASASEYVELQTRAHLKYVEFSRGLPGRRAQERRSMARLAAAEAIADLMEEAPGLDQCTGQDASEEQNQPPFQSEGFSNASALPASRQVPLPAPLGGN